MAGLPLHIAVLEKLARELHERREQLKERMAKGLQQERYAEHVGRASELQAMLERVEELIDRLRQGELEEDDNDVTEEEVLTRGRRTKRRIASAREAQRGS